MVRALSDYRPQIEAALVYADASHTYDDVAAMVAAGQAQFWPGPASVVITEVVAFPRKKVLNIFLAGGVMREIWELMPIIEAWAKAQGCVSAQVIGRKGWGRVLARDGWQETASFFVRPL